MEIHELNTFSGTLGSGDFFATDNGNDTSKVSAQDLFAPLNARIDNIIAGPAPSAEEVVDARIGADGVTYSSLGDAVRGQVTDLKSDFNNIADIRAISVEGVFNGYFEVGAKVVVAASYTRMVYAPVPNGASKATVSKTVGKLFRVGFSVDKPNEAGVTIIGDAGTLVDAGQVASVTVDVPSTANYIVATIWNANTDAGTTSAEDMIASVAITMKCGAKDVFARDEIEAAKSDLSNIPPQTIDGIERTGWNYLNDKIEEYIGYYWNGAIVGSPISPASNGSYNAVLVAIENEVYDLYYARYIYLLDADKNLLAVYTTDGTSSVDNTSIHAKYLAVTFHADVYSSCYIKKHGEPSYTQYTAEDHWVFENLAIDTTGDNLYLPAKIYCAVGRTIELYNKQVLLNAEKYNIHWSCDIGTAFARKFSVTATQSMIGNHTLTLKVYDDQNNLLVQKTATIIVADNGISSTLKVLPIGDSLTNGKDWLSEVPTLSNAKIEYIGTRKLSDRYSEGRSGASTTWYVSNSSYTYQDGSTYEGNPSVLGSSNPFWDGSKFSLNHYITQQSSYVGTPDAVQIMLGTNDLKQTATVVSNIKTMVDTIHTEYPTMPIFICNAIFHSNQNGYYSTGGEGYVGAMTNWQYELDRYTIALMSALADVFDKDTYNSFVTLVPVATCMDRENDFGQVSVPVNPRLTSVTEVIPSQYTHPQSAGYLQMADAMYSAYCAKLS